MVVINGALAEFVQQVISAGHGIALESLDSVGRGAKTRIVIQVRHASERGNIGALALRYTFYVDSASEFIGMSEEFGELCGYSQLSGTAFLEVAEKLKSAMLAQSKVDPTWWVKVAGVVSGRCNSLGLTGVHHDNK